MKSYEQYADEYEKAIMGNKDRMVVPRHIWISSKWEQDTGLGPDKDAWRVEVGKLMDTDRRLAEQIICGTRDRVEQLERDIAAGKKKPEPVYVERVRRYEFKPLD